MTVYVNTANKGTVNMRAEPSKSAKVLAQIPYKTTLEAEYVNNLWSKVKYNNKEGYVMTEFLSSGKAVTHADLRQIYDSLKEALDMIEKVMN